jgi:hypothetical protein
MKLPWVRRIHFAALAANNEILHELCAVQKDRITDLLRQNEELKALFSKTSNFEVVKQEDKQITLKIKEAQGAQQVAAHTRSGWRGKRAANEATTVPVPADSMQALEKRVAEAKGPN